MGTEDTTKVAITAGTTILGLTVSQAFIAVGAIALVGYGAYTLYKRFKKNVKQCDAQIPKVQKL
jgi:phosphate/sulfate permease